MIAALAFDTRAVLDDGRAIRRPSFVPRSTLPLSAACLVANGVRETLSRLFATTLDVDLIEPVMPLHVQRRMLLESATTVRVRGRVCDGFVIVRAVDQRRIIALAFGESERPEPAPLSEIERATVERVVMALVPLCNALCGTLGPVSAETNDRAACDLVTYFEVRATGTVPLAIGFAVTNDPAGDVTARITLEDLADVEIGGSVEFGTAALGVPAFSRLATSATLVLETPLGAPGTLRFGNVVFARGTCGVSEGRSAISLDFDIAAAHGPSGASR